MVEVPLERAHSVDRKGIPLGEHDVSLHDVRWPELEGVDSSRVLAIPVGAVEQHGPHLPLSTDLDIARGLARSLALCRKDVLTAPAVAYGASGEHADFPGTLSIGSAALELLLVELGRSACASFSRVLLINAHGGNISAIAAAAARLRGEQRNVRAWSPQWRGDAHAGRVETSLMLALAPGRVRLSAACAGETRPLAELLPRLRDEGVRAVSPSGVLGDPSGAHAEEGRSLLAGAVAELSALIDRWAWAA